MSIGFKFYSSDGGAVSPSDEYTISETTRLNVNGNVITLGTKVYTATAGAGYEFSGWRLGMNLEDTTVTGMTDAEMMASEDGTSELEDGTDEDLDPDEYSSYTGFYYFAEAMFTEKITYADQKVYLGGSFQKIRPKMAQRAEQDADGNVISSTYLTKTQADEIYQSSGSYATSSDLSSKQNTLTAGTNITISNNTISATGNVITVGNTQPSDMLDGDMWFDTTE